MPGGHNAFIEHTQNTYLYPYKYCDLTNANDGNASTIFSKQPLVYTILQIFCQKLIFHKCSVWQPSLNKHTATKNTNKGLRKTQDFAKIVIHITLPCEQWCIHTYIRGAQGFTARAHTSYRNTKVMHTTNEDATKHCNPFWKFPKTNCWSS